VHTVLLCGNMTELGRPRRRRDGNIQMDLHEVEWSKWIGLIWIRTGTGDEYLRMR
jgi:hypothetical protein